MLWLKWNRSSGNARCEKGFTLVELMVTLVILGLIMGVVYKVFSSQERFFRNQEQISAMQENLRATMEYVNQELSWLGYQVPGVAVVKAAPTDIIFKANIPNTGQTIQYVRYQFNPSSHTIWRAAGATASDVSNLVIMASDIESLSFSYYNVLNGVLDVDPTDPPCADELSAAACNPGTPGGDGGDSTLLMIQRIKARVAARTSKPDWQYTDPEGGANPNYRKRKAVLDLKARNVEDVTLQGGQIVVGTCGSLTHTITVPGGNYGACKDERSMSDDVNPIPDQSGTNWYDDNPYVTINALDKDGVAQTDPDIYTVLISAVADDGSTYHIYDSSDYTVQNNTIDNGETRYIVANDESKVITDTEVELRFAYSDGICTQVTYPGDTPIVIGPSAASHFDTGSNYSLNGLALSYVDLGGTDLGLTYPTDVAMCSAVADQAIKLTTELKDDCGNPITGETVLWSDAGAGGSFTSEADNGDGTYTATYIPADTMPSVAPDFNVSLSAQWGSFAPTVAVNLIAAPVHDIVIDSIVDVNDMGIFQFASTVLPRASQLGGNSGNNFTIERIDGQDIRVRFHLEDACGNWVFGESANVTPTSSMGNLDPSTNYNASTGDFHLYWESDIGCGIVQPDESINISVSTIANPGTQTEAVAFDLLTTRSQDPDAGPFLVMDSTPLGGSLQAGNTSDNVLIEGTVMQYDPVKEYCTNITTFPRVFPFKFNVAGGPGGNGSFSNSAPFDDIEETVSSSDSGVGDVRLYSGTADWDDSLVVTATATVGGEDYIGNISVGMVETFHPPDTGSGFFSGSDYLASEKIGSTESINTFNPGVDLYLQIFDYDENEDPNQPDSDAVDPDPDRVKVTLESDLTGDVETVNLTEWADNTAEFRLVQATVFNTVATSADGVLQTRDGDTVTMYFEDKDTPADNFTWTIYTPGADSFRVAKVVGSDTFDLFSGGVQVEDVTYGDKLRPMLSLPFLAGDGSLNDSTVTITVDSGAADADTIVLREEEDTGIMVPDWTIYAGKHFSLVASDTGDEAYLLETPTTPRYINMEYDAAGSYTESLTFFMRDYDKPDVSITFPTSGSTVSSIVTVLVDANDTANATSWAGIYTVELYINDRLFHTLIAPPDLSGSNAITWETAVGGQPRWLDGGHTLKAVAYDSSGNIKVSVPVAVTVENNLSPITPVNPGDNSIWSQDVDVSIDVDNFAAASGTHELYLSVNSVTARIFTITTGGVYTHTVDTTALPEGTADVIAILKDLQTNESVPTAIQFIVDRTAPTIDLGTPPVWLTENDLPLDVDVTIYDTKVNVLHPNDVDDSTVAGYFSGACSSPFLPMSYDSGDTYNIYWADSATDCIDVEGPITLSVEAEDMAYPANASTNSVATLIDTKEPVVDSFDVLPYVNQPFVIGTQTFDGFISGDMTLSATVSDGYLDSGYFVVQYYQDPGKPTSDPDWGAARAFGPMDVSGGGFIETFSYLWSSTSVLLPGPYPNGFYVVAATVKDQAGNLPDIPPYYVLYLDNGVPLVNLPQLDLTYGIVRGPAPVTGAADPNFGFLRDVTHAYVIQGDDPDLGTVYKESFSYPVGSQQRSGTYSYILDPSSWDDGFYEAYSYATDWAGNTVRIGPSTPFEVRLRHIDSASAGITFKKTVTIDWIESSARLVDGAGNGVAGEPLMADLVRFYWNSCLNPFDLPACTLEGYEDVAWASTWITTDLNGDIPSIAAPANTWWQFAEEDRALLILRDNFTGNRYGYVEAYLDNPQPVGVFNPADQFFRQRPLFSDLNYSIASTTATENEFEVSGVLVGLDGQPLDGATVWMHWEYTDPIFGFVTEERTQISKPDGSFSFNFPSYNLLLPNDTSALFYLDVYYYHSDWIPRYILGDLYWDWTIGTWQENLHVW